MNNPIFLFVIGPNSSGKNALPKYVDEYLKLSGMLTNSTKTETILIDNLVEKNPYYKHTIDNYLKDFKNVDGEFNINELKKKFINPDDKLLDYYNNAYMKARKHTNCETGEETTKIEKTCDNINDTNLLKALETKKNIIFETNGTYFPRWVFRQLGSHISAGKYNIIMAWSVVSLCNLIERNKTRAITSLENYLNDNIHNTPPRLPDIRKKIYNERLHNIIKTFKTIISYYNIPVVSNLRILIFDNQNIPACVYDNYNDSMNEYTAYKAIEIYQPQEKCNKDVLQTPNEKIEKNKSLESSKTIDKLNSIMKSLSDTTKLINKSTNKSIKKIVKKSVKKSKIIKVK